MSKINPAMMRKAPESTGNIIKLQSLVGAPILIEAIRPVEKTTRFGPKKAMMVNLHTPGESYSGLVYSVAFSEMEAGQWYSGRVARDGLNYTLAELTAKELEALCAQVDARLSGGEAPPKAAAAGRK